MDKKEGQEERLQFIFTEHDFSLDVQSAQTPGEWGKRFEKDRYYALYQMGFEEKLEELTATGVFLRLISDSFLRQLTSLPELELVRELAVPEPSDEDIETLLKAAPFAIGAEYVTKKWIKAVWGRLTGIFAGEIAQYNGTVPRKCRT